MLAGGFTDHERDVFPMNQRKRRLEAAAQSRERRERLAVLAPPAASA
jgi:hypothetical protein